MELRLALTDEGSARLSQSELAALRNAATQVLVLNPAASDPSACWRALRRGGLSWIPSLEGPNACDHPAMGTDWPRINERRIALIHKSVNSVLSPTEADELAALQQFTDARTRLLSPLPIQQLEAIRDDLVRRGMWDGE